MNKRSSLLLLIVFLAGTRSAVPCGDKFVAFGRGVRFRSAFAAAHPSLVLVYMKSGSDVAAADQRYQFITRLTLVGHRLAIVPTERELNAALHIGRYDVVLTDANDVNSVQNDVKTARANTVVVPVLYNRTPDELASVEKQYGHVISASGRNPRFEYVIDDAIRSRVGGGDFSTKTSR